MNDYILFSWGEFATFEAAVSTLAKELEPTLRSYLTKAQRESLARLMFKTSKGTVEIGRYTVQWYQSDEYKRDTYYMIEY